MESVKNLPSRRVRNVRAWKTVACVDDKIVPADVYRLKVEAASFVVSKLLELGIEWLLGSDLIPIHAHVAYRGDDAVEVGNGGCSLRE